MLRLWQGLGYYTRARNLHRCALTVTRELNGKFPADYSGLLTLPGIGKYTAAAIASIAYQERRAVVDGNVFRVIARLYGIKKNIAESRNRKSFEEIVNELIPGSSPGDFNQAIMELGATVCSPRDPDCPSCPLKKFCVACSENLQKQLPVNRKNQTLKTRIFNYYIIHYRNRIFMKKRMGKDIWKGLYEFYLVEPAHPDKNAVKAGKTIKQLMNAGKADKKPVVYKSVLSHQVIKANFLHLHLNDKDNLKKLLDEPGTGLFTRKEAELLPKPVLIDNYLKEGFF